MIKLPLSFPVTQTSGYGRGKKLGIPTINFKIPKNLNLSYGVYAGWLFSEFNKFPAAIHFGPRPQFSETDPSLEAFILDGALKNPPASAILKFVKFMRTIQTFPTVEKMLEQIQEDIAEIRKVLSPHKKLGLFQLQTSP